MKLKFKIIGLMITFLIIAYLVISLWWDWVNSESAKVDDYQMIIKTGWVSEPTLEVRSEYKNALR